MDGLGVMSQDHTRTCRQRYPGRGILVSCHAVSKHNVCGLVHHAPRVWCPGLSCRATQRVLQFAIGHCGSTLHKVTRTTLHALRIMWCDIGWMDGTYRAAHGRRKFD